MKPSLTAAVAALVAAFAAAGPASAATLRVDPMKRCFGANDRLNFVGEGYAAGGIVDFTRDGDPIEAREPIVANSAGSVRARLTVLHSGRRERRTYAAADRGNPANTASVRVTVSELAVRVRPRGGRSNEPRRITAAGFTFGSSRTLWAHVVFRGSVRNLRIGTLRGACRTLTTTKRLFGAQPPFGRHRVYFDTRRRFRRRGVRQRIWFPFDISRPAAAAAPAQAAAGSAAATGAFEKVSSPSAASTSTRSPAWNSPSSSFSASLSTSRF
jgi:hypothetical protein